MRKAESSALLSLQSLSFLPPVSFPIITCSLGSQHPLGIFLVNNQTQGNLGILDSHLGSALQAVLCGAQSLLALAVQLGNPASSNWINCLEAFRCHLKKLPSHTVVKVVYRGYCGLWFRAFFKHKELGKSVVAECDCSCMCSPRIKRTNVSYVESWAGEAYVEMRGSREVGSAPAGEGSLGLMLFSPPFFLLPSSSSLD